MPDREHLMGVWFPTDPRIATDLLRHNYREPFDAILDYYEDQQDSIARQHAPPYRHAAMIDCSSLLAEVIPIPPGRWPRCGNNRAGRACTGAGDHLVTHHAKRNIRKPIVVAQADDADRPPSAPDTPSSRHPPPLCRPAQHFEKDGSVLSKRPPYSGVQRCPQHHARTTSSGGSRPWSLPPQRNCYPGPVLAPPPLTHRLDRPAIPTPALPPAPHQRVSKPLRARAPPAPRPSRRRRIRLQPGRRTYRPSPPGPAPSQFPQSMARFNAAWPAQRYSCAVQQRRRPTPAHNTRHRPATCGNNHH
jgi:hypothetical protein